MQTVYVGTAVYTALVCSQRAMFIFQFAQEDKFAQDEMGHDLVTLVNSSTSKVTDVQP